MKTQSPSFPILIAVLLAPLTLAGAPSAFDQKFVSEVSQTGLKKMELSQTAVETSSSKEVKEYAAKMVEDHSKVSEELKAIADDQKLTMEPELSGEHLKAANNVRGKAEEEFDAAYAGEMVQDHQAAVKLFEEAAAKAQAPALKGLAAKHLPILKQHLKEAEALQEKLKDKTKDAAPTPTQPKGKNS